MSAGAPAAKYYHGGRSRLRAGEKITPGRKPNPWGDTFDEKGRSIFVYCTTDLSTAESYADAIRRVGGRGYVYEVRPLGVLWPDGHGSDFKSVIPLEVVERLS